MCAASARARPPAGGAEARYLPPEVAPPAVRSCAGRRRIAFSKARCIACAGARVVLSYHGETPAGVRASHRCRGCQRARGSSLPAARLNHLPGVLRWRHARRGQLEVGKVGKVARGAAAAAAAAAARRRLAAFCARSRPVRRKPAPALLRTPRGLGGLMNEAAAAASAALRSRRTGARRSPSAPSMREPSRPLLLARPPPSSFSGPSAEDIGAYVPFPTTRISAYRMMHSCV